jgi:putative nucleotidyltransferase with HDIG domain
VCSSCLGTGRLPTAVAPPSNSPHAAARFGVADGSPCHEGTRLSEVLAGLSYALDLTEGQRPGHAVRTCLIGMRLGKMMRLPPGDQSSLFYALLMKDLGCSSNAARFAALFGSDDQDLKAQIKTIDWTRALDAFRYVLRNVAPGQRLLTRTWRLLALMSNGRSGARDVVRTRCERGAEIARLIGLDTDSAEAIRALDEHWDGQGQPYARRGHDIPRLARILNLAQTVEVFVSSYGVLTAYDMAAARRGSWFEPALVDALLSIPPTDQFWASLATRADLAALAAVEPPDSVLVADEDQIDRIAEGFARVIDAKSPWTYRHSTGVADIAVAIGTYMGWSPGELRLLRRSALLHDLGKLGVSNLILDKPARLTDQEFAVMRQHTIHTAEILHRVGCFRELVDDAAGHHERLDGRGYHRGLVGRQVGRHARVLAVADICDALRASRPYRDGLPPERVLDIMRREAGGAIWADAFLALEASMNQTASEHTGAAPVAIRVAALAEDYGQAA